MTATLLAHAGHVAPHGGTQAFIAATDWSAFEPCATG